MLDGSIKEGDQVLLMPGEISARVRQLQIHGNHVPEAHPGQRVAVNLAGVERQGIHRGQVLFKGEGLEPVDKVAGRFYLLPSAPVLTSNTRIRFHCGSSETIGRAVILGADQVEPGKDALVQFSLEEPVVAVRVIAMSFAPGHRSLPSAAAKLLRPAVTAQPPQARSGG